MKNQLKAQNKGAGVQKTNVLSIFSNRNFAARQPVTGRTVTIIAPAGAKKTDRFFSQTVTGSSLERFGISPGDQVTMKANFHLAEIKPLSLCVVEIGGHRYLRPIEIIEGQIVVYYADQSPVVYDRQEIKILGIAVECRRKLI